MTARPGTLAAVHEWVAGRLGVSPTGPRADELEQALLELRLSRFRNGPADEWIERLRALPLGSDEWQRLATAARVGETYFFRDEPLFDALKSSVLPGLIAERDRQDRHYLRIWSAACASGEEPYSIAILLDVLLPDPSRWSVTILATDIHLQTLAGAQHGLYRDWSLRGVPDWVRARYFRRRGEAFELEPRIRAGVSFAPLNLADDEYSHPLVNAASFDLIFCRNVLMYFKRSVQRNVARRLTQALAPGGLLMTSPAEASSDLFRPLVRVFIERTLVYRKLEQGVSPASAPVAVADAGRRTPGRITDSPRPPLRPPDTRSATTTVPVENEPLLARVRSLADRGFLDEAARLCQTAVAQDRFDVETHLLAAAIGQENDDLAAALEHARRAMYLAPEHPMPHFVMGTLSLRRGLRPQALRSLRAAIELLARLPPDAPIEHAGGLTTAQLRATARACIEAARG